MTFPTIEEELPPPRPGASIVICTYNGGKRIERVLAALAAQTTDVPFEILLVDNNSRDGVGDIARRYWDGAGSSVPLRIIPEPQQGLSFARKKGVVSARYELVIFCDDDNLLCPTYVGEATRLMRDPRFVAVGGPGIPIFEAPPPSFVFSRIGYWACGDKYASDEEVGAEHTVLSDGQPRNIPGAGLTIRRDDFIKLLAVEDFPILTDRSGAALSGGNDCEICFMLMIAGGKLIFSDKLRFDHIIPAERLTEEYFHRLVGEGGPGREYWRRLADYHVAKRDGWRSISPRAALSAARTLITRGGDRGRLFRAAVHLNFKAVMNETEKTALRMARRAEAMTLQQPLNPSTVVLKTRPDWIGATRP